MKKIAYFLGVAFLGFILVNLYKCETDPTETCKMDEICTDKSVTACCTESECVYKYNGTEYPDTDEGLTQLAKDLGCGTAGLKSGGSEDITGVIDQLKVLMESVHEETK